MYFVNIWTIESNKIIEIVYLRYFRFWAEEWMCWFYNNVCLYYFFASWDNKNVSIFFNNIFSDRKVNLNNTLEGSIVKISQWFSKAERKQSKNLRKHEILRQFGLGFWCNCWTNYRKYMTFSLNVCIRNFYTK